jgi:hypothetical protein
VSELGFGPWRKANEDFLATFECSYQVTPATVAAVVCQRNFSTVSFACLTHVCRCSSAEQAPLSHAAVCCDVMSTPLPVNMQPTCYMQACIV